MHEMSTLWLRVAAVLYSAGLTHALLTVLRSRANLFPLAQATFRVGVVVHAVSIVEEAIYTGSFPANNFFESISLCALLIAVVFLLVHWRYQFEGLSVFLFPLVFLMALLGGLGTVSPAWTNPAVRDAWLLVHVILVLGGYAALLLMAGASVFYLAQERKLKRKKPGVLRDRVPPLAKIDEIISWSMAAGFVLITLSVVAGITWAFVESGTRWVGEPKIIISLATWALYLGVVFVRVSAGWRGRKAALLSITLVGFSAATWVAHTGLRNLLSK
jgi:ABC-type uncharacterized transport system permease subunit